MTVHPVSRMARLPSHVFLAGLLITGVLAMIQLVVPSHGSPAAAVVSRCDQAVQHYLLVRHSTEKVEVEEQPPGQPCAKWPRASGHQPAWPRTTI